MEGQFSCTVCPMPSSSSPSAPLHSPLGSRDLERYKSRWDEAIADRDAKTTTVGMAGPPRVDPSSSSGLPTKQRHQVLHLFSGPSPRTDGLASYLRAVDIGTTDVDVVNVHLEDQDLVDDAVWTRLRQRLLNGDFSFVFAGPPCRTFSDARLQRPGPPVLRNQEFIYGFPKSQARRRGLRPEHFEQIRIDNLLAERTAEACIIMHDVGFGYAVEQPWGSKALSISMFDLECFVEFKTREPSSQAFTNACSVHHVPSLLDSSILERSLRHWKWNATVPI